MAHQYVHRAPSGVFHLRVPVPLAARSALGRREIKRTLRTRDLSRALALARHYLPDILDRVDAARQTMDDEKLKRLLSDPNVRLNEFTVTVKRPQDGLELQIEVDPLSSCLWHSVSMMGPKNCKFHRHCVVWLR